MYVTCQPCNACAKMLINGGIETVFYEGDYPDDFSLELFQESHLSVFRLVEGQLEQITWKS